MLNISNIQDPPDLSIIRGYPCTMSAKIGFFSQRICAMVPLEYHWRWWCYMLILKRPHSEIPEKSPKPNLRRFCDSAWSPVFIFMQLPSHYSTYMKICLSSLWWYFCIKLRHQAITNFIAHQLNQVSHRSLCHGGFWDAVSLGPLELLSLPCKNLSQFWPLTVIHRWQSRMSGIVFWHFAPPDGRIILSLSH